MYEIDFFLIMLKSCSSGEISVFGLMSLIFCIIIQLVNVDLLKRYPETLFEALLQITSYTVFLQFQ